MSVNRSVWSEAFLLQQLPAPACRLNLSAPQHPAPSSAHRRSAPAHNSFCLLGWLPGTAGTRMVPAVPALCCDLLHVHSCDSSGQCCPTCTLPGAHSSVCERSLLNFLVTPCVMAKTGNDRGLVKNCNCCVQDRFVQTTTELHSPRGKGQFQ